MGGGSLECAGQPGMGAGTPQSLSAALMLSLHHCGCHPSTGSGSAQGPHACAHCPLTCCSTAPALTPGAAANAVHLHRYSFGPRVLGGHKQMLVAVPREVFSGSLQAPGQLCPHCSVSRSGGT